MTAEELLERYAAGERDFLEVRSYELSMHTPRLLDLIDLGWAIGLIAIAIGLVQWQKLGLSGQIALAASRSILQLLVMGFVLQIVWQLNNPYISIAAILAIALVTSIAATKRISEKIGGLYPIVGGAILTGLIVALIYTIAVVIKPENWDQPNYLFACAGLCLGYLLNSVAVAGERLVSAISQHQAEIETHLSLGATSSQAVAVYRRAAVKAALLPTIDTLMVAGLVTLPGFLTGEFIGNVAPLNATAYQIVVLFMVMLANTIATLIVTDGIARKHFINEQLTINN
jgi:putative ABC transport system permease protein